MARKKVTTPAAVAAGASTAAPASTPKSAPTVSVRNLVITPQLRGNDVFIVVSGEAFYNANPAKDGTDVLIKDNVGSGSATVKASAGKFSTEIKATADTARLTYQVGGIGCADSTTVNVAAIKIANTPIVKLSRWGHINMNSLNSPTAGMRRVTVTVFGGDNKPAIDEDVRFEFSQPVTVNTAWTASPTFSGKTNSQGMLECNFALLDGNFDVFIGGHTQRDLLNVQCRPTSTPAVYAPTARTRTEPAFSWLGIVSGLSIVALLVVLMISLVYSLSNPQTTFKVDTVKYVPYQTSSQVMDEYRQNYEVQLTDGAMYKLTPKAGTGPGYSFFNPGFLTLWFLPLLIILAILLLRSVIQWLHCYALWRGEQIGVHLIASGVYAYTTIRNYFNTGDYFANFYIVEVPTKPSSITDRVFTAFSKKASNVSTQNTTNPPSTQNGGSTWSWLKRFLVFDGTMEVLQLIIGPMLANLLHKRKTA